MFLLRCSSKELVLSITPECTGAMAVLLMTDEYCGLLGNPKGVFSGCMAQLNDLYLENCKYDVCSNQDDPVKAKEAACRSLAAFNLECSNIGQGADYRDVAKCGEKSRPVVVSLPINDLTGVLVRKVQTHIIT